MYIYIYTYIQIYIYIYIWDYISIWIYLYDSICMSMRTQYTLCMMCMMFMYIHLHYTACVWYTYMMYLYNCYTSIYIEKIPWRCAWSIFQPWWSPSSGPHSESLLLHIHPDGTNGPIGGWPGSNTKSWQDVSEQGPQWRLAKSVTYIFREEI